ncbi:MAG TPA: DNA-3-methyladenine glycosylase [Bacteroidales bacterium]|jgi:DNA-3-methyladenine glycosylase
MLLDRSFYQRENVVAIARELIGKYIVTTFDGKLTSGMITETEAYAGITDKASHAFGGRNSARTEIMYRQGGTAYVYLCYGIHSLFNIVTNYQGTPHAILIRAFRPMEGINVMERRMGRKAGSKSFASGPGNVAKALGIHYGVSGADLCAAWSNNKGNRIWVEDRGISPADSEVLITPRIGIAYAGEDALLPYRFVLK